LRRRSVGVVQPRCLVCVDHAWYVVANDPMRNGAARRFALFRKKSAKDTDREFTPAGPFCERLEWVLCGFAWVPFLLSHTKTRRHEGMWGCVFLCGAAL
jgi:hypothetical protein